MRRKSDNPYKTYAAELTGQYEKAYIAKLDKFHKETKITPPKDSIKSLNELLTNHFIVGEYYFNTSSKKFLIQNMQRFKLAGFTTLFIEGMLYDDQQALNEFGNPAQSLQDEERIRNRLALMDHCNSHTAYESESEIYNGGAVDWEANNYSALVKAAKLAGIRVVGIDTEFEISNTNLLPMSVPYSVPSGQESDSHSYSISSEQESDAYRCKSINYVAYHIIRREMKSNGGKWIALVGANYMHTVKDALGLSELTGARCISFDADCDNIPQSGPKVRLNYKLKENTIDAKIDVFVKAGFGSPTPTPTLFSNKLPPVDKDKKLEFKSTVSVDLFNKIISHYKTTSWKKKILDHEYVSDDMQNLQRLRDEAVKNGSYSILRDQVARILTKDMRRWRLFNTGVRSYFENNSTDVVIMELREAFKKSN